MPNNGFIKLVRGEELLDILKQHPNAFLLLTLIAARARRTESMITGLKTGQALIGDYRACGLSHQKYRTAIKQLESINLITTKTTNKGTVATLCNSDIYDINPDDGNSQSNTGLTTDQQTDNKPPTTNKEGKNEKKGIELPPLPLSDLLLHARETGSRKSLDLMKCEDLAHRCYAYYEEMKWKDKNGNRILALKAKLDQWMSKEVEQLKKTYPEGFSPKRSQIGN